MLIEFTFHRKETLHFIGASPLATVVQREEFLRLLLDLAAAGLDPERRSTNKVIADASDKLYDAFARTGITDPADTLKNIRLRYVAIERVHPEMSNATRASIAIFDTIGTEGAGGDFLGRLHSWFDQSIDRVQDIFTTRMRQVTFVMSVILVSWLHFDSIDLLNRLSRDESLRNELVKTAVMDYEGYKPVASQFSARVAVGPDELADPVEPAAAVTDTATDADVAPPSESEDVVKRRDCAADAGNINAYLRCAGLGELAGFGVIYIPDGGQTWVESWRQDPLTGQPRLWMRHLFGMVLSVALLCLGALFWYATLSNFIRLRSALAQKDETARTERQTTQAARP